MKRTLLSALLVLSFLIMGSAQAQEGNRPIAYGQTVTGEITNEQFEVPFDFTGSAGDFAVAQLNATDGPRTLGEATLLLLDANRAILASVEDFYPPGTLVFQLPTDGTYTLVATRLGGQAGQDVGGFELRLAKAQVLSANTPVQETVATDDPDVYVVQARGPFTLAYEKRGGTLSPAIEVYRVSGVAVWEEVAILHGRQLSAGTMLIQISSNIAAETYLVVAEHADFDYYDEEPVQAEYTLTLQE